MYNQLHACSHAALSHMLGCVVENLAVVDRRSAAAPHGYATPPLCEAKQKAQRAEWLEGASPPRSIRQMDKLINS